MNDNDINRLIFLTLNSISEIVTPKVSMWSLSNKYAYPPYFSFKFKQNDQRLYERLQGAIRDFKGHFQWEMQKFDHPASSYVIAPLQYINKFHVENGEEIRGVLLKDMALVEYERMIDAVINEVPALSDHISLSMR